jgi:Cu(I)/Ag(I) efflux system membrane fusion protein
MKSYAGTVVTIAALLTAAGAWEFRPAADIASIHAVWAADRKQADGKQTDAKQAAPAPAPASAPVDEFEEFAESDEAGGVEIPEAVLRKLGVKTSAVEKRKIRRTLKIPGIVSFDETALYTINAKYAGWIEKLYLNYEGKYVKKGGTVAELYSPQLVAAGEELLALARFKGAGDALNDKSAVSEKGAVSDKSAAVSENVAGISSASDADTNEKTYSSMFARDTARLVAAAKSRLRWWDVTDKEIDDIIASGKVRRTLPVYSPASGYVIKKLVTEGAQVAAGQGLFQIADLSRVWIIGDVFERDLPYMRPAQPVSVALANYPGVTLKSKVDYIYPELSEKTRTVKVRFPVNNFKGILRPGMFTEVSVSMDLGVKLIVPEDAVIDDGKRTIVFIKVKDGVYQPHEVTLGAKGVTDTSSSGGYSDTESDNKKGAADTVGVGYYEAVAGLKEGDIVARGASFLLDSEAQLKGVKPVK